MAKVEAEQRLEGYEPPAVRELGTVHELTQTTVTVKSSGSDDGTGLGNTAIGVSL